MTRLSMVLLVLCVPMLVACGGSTNQQDALRQLQRALPTASEGWDAAEAGTIYDANSIFSYIDGHAEVYLAYGMRRCLARRYSGPEGEADIVVDVFELPSAADAFGVFTHDLDGEPVGVGNDGLLRYGWLSFWKGRFFISVYAESESESSRQAVLSLGRAVEAAIDDHGERPAIVGMLPSAGLQQRSVRFLRNQTILNGHVFVSEENVFALGPDTEAVLGRYTRDDATGYLLVVGYGDAGDQANAVRAFSKKFLGGATAGDPVESETGSWQAVGLKDRYLVAVIGADTAALAAGLIAEVDTG